MKNMNYILFSRVVFNLTNTTTAWVRRNRDSELIKQSAQMFKDSESQLEKMVTDRRQLGLKYKTIFT